MPYIKNNRKFALDLHLKPVSHWIRNCGELNYAFTKLLIGYLETKGLSYQTCNDIVGALENAKNEFQARVQRKYEDEKIKSNGDVYENIHPNET